MLRVIAIDDEPLILDNLTYIFNNLEDAELVASFLDPMQALKEYSELQPDAVIIDINMPKINGLDFAERIKELDPMANILFLTAYDNYAINAFNVGAVDYLLKPVTESMLRKSLQRIRAKSSGQNSVSQTGPHTIIKIPALTNNHIHLIDPADALYITVSARRVYCVTDSMRYELQHAIGYWEEALKTLGWFRCHRCYLLNLHKVCEVSLMFNNTYDVRLYNCTESIPVSRTYFKSFQKHFNL